MRAEGSDSKLAVIPGLPPISVEGTKYATSFKNDLVDVYKMYMRTKMTEAGNALPPLLDADFAEVREMLRLPEQCDSSTSVKLKSVAPLDHALRNVDTSRVRLRAL
jgi:hypothetical protein